ncbi:MAG: helix-turn-helix domain-containing protein [Patescibacteria group bacterium]|nr:helix-turn-helix domain-containing protein [Patescibacteria group bacterium]
MKKKQQNLQWHSFDEVFSRSSKKKEFRLAYNEEIVRLRLARQIRNLRTTSQMTQLIVAKKSGMPQSVIARVESGDRGISVDTLGRIAHTLGKEVQLV